MKVFSLSLSLSCFGLIMGLTQSRQRSQPYRISSSLSQHRHLGSALFLGCICGRKGDCKPLSQHPHPFCLSLAKPLNILRSLYLLTSTTRAAWLWTCPPRVPMDRRGSTHHLKGSPASQDWPWTEPHHLPQYQSLVPRMEKWRRPGWQILNNKN